MDISTQTKGKIFILEDDSTMISVLKTLLEIEGYQVTIGQAFRKQEEILQSIQSTSPDAMLIDVHLHNLNGIDLLKVIRSIPSLQQVRIIMTSGMYMNDECMAAGADGFLLKPYMPDELIHIIEG